MTDIGPTFAQRGNTDVCIPPLNMCSLEFTIQRDIQRFSICHARHKIYIMHKYGYHQVKLNTGAKVSPRHKVVHDALLFFLYDTDCFTFERELESLRVR